MRAIQQLRDLGQSLWLDQITRDRLSNGTLRRLIEEASVTGLTANATALDHAIRHGSAYDDAIRKKLTEDRLGEALFLELTLEDLRHAADLLRPIYDQTDGVDGWVSLEVSPLLVHDPALALAAARDLHARARRPNFFIEIPGTPEGLSAVEEAIFAGVPVNVTLLFSREQYLAAAGAFLRGIERRMAVGLTPKVGSVASVSVNGWDAAVRGKVPDKLCGRLDIAMARRAYKAYRDLLASQRWERACNAGARLQRLLWTGTADEDSEAPAVYYVSSLAAPLTVNSMSEAALKAFDKHGDRIMAMPLDGGDCETVLALYVQAGIDLDALAGRLQTEGIAAKVKSWFELMTAMASKSAALATDRTTWEDG